MQDAMRLYSSAVDKFEKVLALKPDNMSVLVTCGLALKDMALCMSLDDPDTLINLEVSLPSCAVCGGCMTYLHSIVGEVQVKRCCWLNLAGGAICHIVVANDNVNYLRTHAVVATTGLCKHMTSMTRFLHTLHHQLFEELHLALC